LVHVDKSLYLWCNEDHFFPQELSRGKAEAVKLLQQNMQQKLTDLGTKMSERLQSSELTNKQLEAEVMSLKRQIEEQDEANKKLVLKLKSMQDKRYSAEITHVDSEGNFELEVAVKEFENKLQAAEMKLAEKETMIAEFKANSERFTTEHNKKLMTLQAEVEIALADKLQAECELSERGQLSEEGQKVLAEVQSQLDLESSKKVEAKEKYIALLNKMGSLYVAVKDKDAEMTSSEIVSLKEEVQSLELKLSEAAEECIKIGREKENLSSGLVGSFKAVSQCKQSLQALRKDVYDRLNHVKEDINRVGFQMMGIFELTKREMETVRRELQNKDDIHTDLRANISVLEKELSEQKAVGKCERDLEEMLEDLKLSKKNLETELSENNALIRKLQHELQNMTKTLEKKEQEICHLQDSVTDLQKEITQKMKVASDDLITIRNDYKIKLQSKDTEISDLKNKHNEYCRKIISLESEVSIAESNLGKFSENYMNLKLENEKLQSKVKELEDQFDSLKTEFVALTEEKTGLAGTVEELTRVLTGHRQENDVLSERLQMLTDSLSHSNNETTELRVQTEKLSNELRKACEEKKVLEHQIEDIRETHLKVTENLKSQEEVWNNMSKLDKGEIKRLETALQALQKELMNEKQQLELETSNLLSQLKQSQQREVELLAEAEMLKEENFRAKGDQLNLKCELEQAQQMVQLLSAQIENVNKESADQGQLLKEKQGELEIIVAERDTVLAKFTAESTKVVETEAKLIALCKEGEKCLEELTLLKAKEEEIMQSNIKLEEQLNMKAQRTNYLEDECKCMKESNDLLTKQFDELNLVVSGLKKTSKENCELIEQLKAEKSGLENAIDNYVTQEKEISDKIGHLNSEVIHLNLQNESLTSEVEIKTQCVKELKKELQQSMFERNVVEETRLDLEEQLGKLLKEKSSLEEQLNEASSKKERQEDELLKIEKVYSNNKELQKQLNTALKEKLVLEQTLTTSLGNLKGLQAGELREQVEDNLLEETDLKYRLSDDVEKAREVQSLERLLVEKEQLEHQLDNTLVDLQVKENQLAEFEEIHSQKIKQLVHDFEKQLAQKDEELTNLQNKKFGKYGRSVFQKYTLMLVTGGRYEKPYVFKLMHSTTSIPLNLFSHSKVILYIV
jgi:chromosome segregation ATPase